MLHEWIFAASATAVGLGALTLVTSYAAYRLAFYNKRKEKFNPFFSPERIKDYPFRDRSNELITALVAEPYEDVEITASDGKHLAGRYYHRADGAPLDIMFHGYMSGALHDFPGGALEAMAAGHNVLLVDQRGDGALRLRARFALAGARNYSRLPLLISRAGDKENRRKDGFPCADRLSHSSTGWQDLRRL